MRPAGRLLLLAGRSFLLSAALTSSPALAAAPAAPPPGATPLRELLEDYRSAAPSSPGFALRGRTTGIGHLRLRFDEGALFPLRTRRGALLGFYFSGRGVARYVTEDAADQEAFRLKLSRAAPSLAGSAPAIQDTFRRILLIQAAPGFVDEMDLSPPSAGAAPRLEGRAASGFRRLWKRLGEENPNWDHLAAEARVNSGAGQWIRIALEGGRLGGIYTFDTLRDHRETLSVARRSSGRHRLEPLSLQPIAGEGMRFGPLCLRDLDIELDARRRPAGTITSDLSLEATRDGVRLASFLLINHVAVGSVPWSSPRGRLKVVRLTDATGRDLAFSHRYHELLVELPRTLSRGDTLRLHVETEGEIFGRKGRDPSSGAFALAGIPWYPSPAGWGPDGFTFKLRVRTREPVLPAATGRRIELTRSGNDWTLVSKSVVPVRRLAVVAANYRTRKVRAGGHAILYYFLEPDSAATPEMAGRLLEDLEELLGPYPYGDLQVVEAPVYGFGAALPGMVLVPGGRIKPREDLYARSFHRDLSRRLAHEIARQWFGQKVFPASPRDAWLSDSVAEYLSNVAFSDTAPPAEGNARFLAGLEEWGWEARGCRTSGSLTVAGFLLPDSSGPARFCLLFNRGPAVLEMLRLALGDARFFSILRRTLQTARLDLTSAETFRRIAEETSRKDLGWFFEDWILRGGIPEVRVSWEVRPADAGGATVTGQAVQPAGPGFRRLQIPLELEFPDGRRQTRMIFQDTPVAGFRFRLPERPRRIGVDSRHRTLASYLLPSP